MAWTGVHCAFAVETFSETGEFFTYCTENFLSSFHVMLE